MRNQFKVMLRTQPRCTCGWTGKQHEGEGSERAALVEFATHHREEHA